uniref:Uncharacterized protein n=1 Tax=Oncorhynchus tshawytscha TaxID=74940 RepID=A0A8C8MIY8_ONCTS
IVMRERILEREVHCLVFDFMMFKNVFRFGWLIRTVHVILTWVITLILFLHDTDLQRQEESGECMQHVVFSLLVLLSVMLYFTLSLMHPEFVHSVLNYILGVCYVVVNMYGFFSPLGLKQQPMRAKYCQTCKHCIRGNYRRFIIIYLAVQLLALLWAHQIAWSGFHSAATWKLWLSVNGFLLTALSTKRILFDYNHSHIYPPQADTSMALNELYLTLCKLETIYPEAAFIVAGDFNKANLKTRLPKFYQHID